jgi:hypothetical protein
MSRGPALLILLLLILPSTAFAQQPHWYVLLEPGNERWYWGQDGHDFHEVVTGYQDGYSVVERNHYYDGEVLDFHEELWLIEADGDVWMGETCYIDMPLEIGKNWGRRWGEWDQYYDLFNIVRWDDIWGMNCIMIQERIDDGSGAEFIINRWYADGVGLVHWEMSCAMCSYHLDQVTVETEKKAFGNLKALYRH